MKFLFSTMLLSALALPGLASADDRDDDDRHGRWHGGWYQVAPGWEHRGYWDGRYRHVPPPIYYGPPVVEYRYYIPAPAPYYYDGRWGRWREWDDDDD